MFGLGFSRLVQPSSCCSGNLLTGQGDRKCPLRSSVLQIETVQQSSNPTRQNNYLKSQKVLLSKKRYHFVPT